MPTQPQIRIWWDATVAAYRMTSPYNRALVDATKSHIPASDRKFDEATKQWIFTEKYLDAFTALLKTVGFQFVLVTRQQVEANAGAGNNGTRTGSSMYSRCSIDNVIIEFVRLLPYDAAKAAYRRAALELHPDKQQGDGSRMASLNATWERIAKEVYGQQ